MNILTPTGYKDINDVNIGDEVVAFDVNTGDQILNLLLSKDLTPVPQEENTFYKINGQWILYKNQSVWVNNRVDHAFNISVGDTVYNDQDQDVEVTSVEEIEGQDWWRLAISGDHSYIGDGLTLHNASRYWVGGGSSSNWNATANTNWGSSSGTQDNASVPTSADDVTFDGAGTAGNTNSTISATTTILTLNITSGYTATMTHNAVLTIAGTTWNYSNSYTIAGSSGITLTGATTITSNGITWPNNLTVSGVVTRTLVGNFSMTGLWTISTAHTINKTAAETWTVAGGITMNGGYLNGTLQELIVTGGTLTQIDGAEGYYVNLTIKGNVTISNRLVKIGGVLKYDSTGGPYTITTTGSNLRLNGGTTLNTNGIVWNTISNQSASAVTHTLTSNLTCSSTLTVTIACTFNKTTTETFTINGLAQVGGFLSGTAEIFLVGGTWTGTATSNGVTSNLTIKPDNSNVTISGNVYYGTVAGNFLKYTTSTYNVITTSSTLNVTGDCSFDTNGITFNNVILTNTTGATYTINSTLTASGTLTIGTGATTAFSGTAGFTCATLLNQSTAATTVTLKDEVTYTVTSSLNCFTTRVGSILLFTSSHASNKANLTLQNGATCQCLASFTRINSSAGRTINTFGGTVTDCTNVRQFYDLSTVSFGI